MYEKTAEDRFINKEKITTKISDIDEFVNEGQKKHLKLIDSILDINDENVENVYDKIMENKDSILYATDLIEFATKIRPKQSKSLMKLLNLFRASGNYVTKKFYSAYLKAMLEDEKEENMRVFPKNNICGAIEDDDAEAFTKYIAETSFDQKATIEITRGSQISFVSARYRNVTYMQLIAYFGSLNCFKLALEKGFDEEGVEHFAVAGGNIEIINILKQKGHSFDCCFDTAIKFHRKEVGDWLLENYKCQANLLHISLMNYNSRSFFFFLINNIRVNEDSIRLSLISASATGNIAIVQHLVERCGAKANENDQDGWPPIVRAARNGHLSVIKYFVEECGADIERKDEEGLTVLDHAESRGYPAVVQYLKERNTLK